MTNGTPALAGVPFTILPVRYLVLAALACAFALQAPAAPVPLDRLEAGPLDDRLYADARAVAVYRDGIRAAAARIASIRPRATILSRDEKLALWSEWSAFADYLLALDSIGKYHRDFYKLRNEARPRALAITYAAFLAQYRGALEMIRAADTIPGSEKILNDAVPELGLPANTYAKVKFRYLNVARVTEYTALEAMYRLAKGESSSLRPAIDADSHFILQQGKGTSQKLTAANALKVIGSAAHAAWFPVQKGVASWMGDTKVARVDRPLITPAQIAKLQHQLMPGDVLLERREWYLSNVGLPGFWPHAAMYVGDREERRRYFDDDDVRTWLRTLGRADGDLEAYLAEHYPRAYQAATKSHDDGHVPRVIEAMSEGVSFTTLEHSAAADTLSALRPRLSKKEKAIALVRAFHYAGRPYDFDFDFDTDAALVCSEVIYRAYETSADSRGLRFPLVRVLGRFATPPNEIVRDFDASFGTAGQQFDLSAFLDGHERERRAVPETVEVFRTSWKRPKWHIATN